MWHEQHNEAHIKEHGLDRHAVEFVLAHPIEESSSLSSGEPILFGYTPDGRFIAVVYIQLDELFVYPITAYEPFPNPEVK